MCLSDFLKYFENIFICMDLPLSYVGVRAHCKWINASEIGGHPEDENNHPIEYAPQYYLKLNNLSKVYFSVILPDQRLTSKKMFPFETHYSGIRVYQAQGKEKIKNIDAPCIAKKYSPQRIINLEKVLEPGEYIIIPVSREIENRNEMEYTLELFFNDKCIRDNSENMKEPLLFENTVFEKIESKNPCTYELFKEGRSYQLKEFDNDLREFMLNEFRKCIEDTDTMKYE